MNKVLIGSSCGISLILTFVGGFLLGKNTKKNINKPVGILYLDKSDFFDNYNLFLELEKNVDKIKNNQTVTFKVVKKNFVPDAK